MNYRVWYSTESFADYIINFTQLKYKVGLVKKKMYESDANNAKNFHTMPDHIKQILYLDAPDLIVEIDSEPIFSVEVSTEAGTGHNVFQRFARLAASVENNVPSFYIYPEAAIIHRKVSGGNKDSKWDTINPLIFQALDEVMTTYEIPALFYYFPSNYRTHPIASSAPNIADKGLKYEPNINYAGSPDSTDNEMCQMFSVMDRIINDCSTGNHIKAKEGLLARRQIRARRTYMQSEYTSKGGNLTMSPLSATEKIPTAYLLNFLSKHENSSYKIGELLRSRAETIVYKVDAAFRGDPYPGALAAIDYLICREGKSFEEREFNLVLAWGDLTVDNVNQTITLTSSKSGINDFIGAVMASETKNLLTKSYSDLQNNQIPRYYMQVRYGSAFSKVKHVRVFSYFADAILFEDGSLWRDA